MANANPQYPTPDDPSTTVGFQRFVNETPVVLPRNWYLRHLEAFPWWIIALYLPVVILGAAGVWALFEMFNRASGNAYTGG